jgi:hypothetical protein
MYSHPFAAFVATISRTQIHTGIPSRGVTISRSSCNSFLSIHSILRLLSLRLRFRSHISQRSELHQAVTKLVPRVRQEGGLNRPLPLKNILYSTSSRTAHTVASRFRGSFVVQFFVTRALGPSLYEAWDPHSHDATERKGSGKGRVRMFRVA